MFRQIWQLWFGIWRRPTTGIALVWAVVWNLLSNLPSALTTGIGRPGHPFSWTTVTHAPSTAAPAVMMSGPALLTTLLFVLTTPFIGAGLYGVLGAAIRGEAVSWARSWSLARRLHGRSWGLLAAGMGYVMVLGLATLALYATMRSAAIGAAGVLIVGSAPWVVRMVGGLFVERVPWDVSAARIWRGGRYGAVLGALLLGVVGTALVEGLAIGLTDVAPSIGWVWSYVVDPGVAVALSAWAFAVYWVERTDVKNPWGRADP